MIVARSWSSEPPPFGLGEPMALRGGDRLGPDGIAGRFDRDLRPWLHAHVEAACRGQVKARRPWFAMPPVIFMGGEITGRIGAARRLAWEADVPHLLLDMSDGGGALGGRGLGPDIAMPSLLSICLATGRCANPLVTVIGIEALGDEARDRLVAMLDPVRGCGLDDETLGVTLDLSCFCWMLLPDDGDEPPPWLDPVTRLVVVEEPTGAAAVELAWIDALTAAAADRGMHGAADRLAWNPPRGAARGRDGRWSDVDLRDLAEAAFDEAYGAAR